jgi:hypothetical protein
MILLVADARTTTRSDVRGVRHELEHAADHLVGCVLDNVGRPRRLPAPSIATTMRSLNERATISNREFEAAAAAKTGDEPEEDLAPIHGEV